MQDPSLRPSFAGARALAMLCFVALVQGCHFGGAPLLPTTARPVPEAAPANLRLTDFTERARWAGLVLRALAQEVWSLGEDAGVRSTERTKQISPATGAFVFEASGPQPNADGTPNFFTARVPTDEALVAVLAHHCTVRGDPDVVDVPGSTRSVAWKAVELRAASNCELQIVRTLDRKGWRFRVLLQGR